MPTLAAIMLAVVLGGPAAAPPITAASTPVTHGRFSVRVQTTSAWTGVRFSPGQIVAHRVTSATPGTDVRPFSQGWIIVPPKGRPASVDIAAVFEEPTGKGSISTIVTKGFNGATTVDVTNRSAAPFAVGRVVNTLRKSPAEIRASRTRLQFLGRANPVGNDVDTDRLVLAFYYPWFGSAYAQPTLSDRPAEALSTREAADVLAMTRQAHSNGIDGFVVSWQGEGMNGPAFDLAVRAAEQTGSLATVYLETHVANPERDRTKPVDPAVVRAWIVEALERADSTAFLRHDGVPVIFVWQMNRLKPAVWAGVLNGLAAEGRRVLLVGDAPLSRYGAVSWGYYQYDPNLFAPADLTARNRSAAFDLRLLAPEAHLYAATVSPGFDAHRATGGARPVVARGPNGERYAATWAAASASAPDWVLVTSWNEWYEGTHVQPGIATGGTALRQTADFAARFKS